jgi:hypothetical protein
MSDKLATPLEYRKHLKVSGYITLGFSTLFFLSGLFFMSYSIVKLGSLENIFSEGVFIIWGSLFFWAVVIYIQYYFYHRPQMISKIFIHEDKIIVKQKDLEFLIPYADIIKIESAAQKSMGGWFKIITEKKVWRFNIMLERADYLLERIIRVRPELMPREDYLKLRTKFILVDQGMGRYSEFFKPPYLVWTIFHLIIIPTFALLMIYYKHSAEEILIHSIPKYFFEMSWQIMVIMIFLQLPFISFLNWLLNKESRKRIDVNGEDKIRNTTYEVSIYRKIFPAYLTALMICLGLYGSSDFNLDYSIVNDEKVPGLKFQKDYVVNQKYNCTDCRFQLHRHDFIAFNHWSVAEIIALPGEDVEIKKYSFKNRTVASNGITKVPSGKIAVRGDQGKSVFLVDLKDVNGKIMK